MGGLLPSWIEKIIPRSRNHTNQKILLNLQRQLKFSFKNPELFVKALTHRSFLEISNEVKKSNERLEFLGDSILGMLVAEELFKRFPDKDEGFLTKYRSQLVDKEALYDAAQKINLSEYVLFDKRYVRGSKEGQKTILADCFEALIGAIYLDKGLSEAKKFVHDWIISPNFQSGEFKVDKNYKGQLLELAHSLKLPTPVYNTVKEEGPDHDKKFLVKVNIGNEYFGSGFGKNKKSAEQEAAKIVLEQLTSMQ